MSRRKTGLGLAILHAAVFVGLAFSAFAISVEGWTSLFLSLGKPYLPGTPPSPVMLVGSLVALVAGGLVFVRALVRKPVPLGISVAVLLGLGLTLFAHPAKDAPPPTSGRANAEIVDEAVRLQRAAATALEAKGETSRAQEDWDALLAQTHPSAVPFRRGLFGSPLGYQVRLRAPNGVLDPRALSPGTLVVDVAQDLASFTLVASGADANGQAMVLTNPSGQPFVLRGTYNPDAAPAHDGVP